MPSNDILPGPLPGPGPLPISEDDPSVVINEPKTDDVVASNTMLTVKFSTNRPDLKQEITLVDRDNPGVAVATVVLDPPITGQGQIMVPAGGPKSYYLNMKAVTTQTQQRYTVMIATNN